MNASDNNQYHLGFDLGGTKMLAVVYDQDWQPLQRERVRTNGHEGQEAVVERLLQSIESVCDAADIPTNRLASIGIGVPGSVNMATGDVLGAVNLGWKRVPLGEILRDRYDCPVEILNDVDAGVYGESQCGAGKDGQNVMGVFPGTGIGGGAVFSGEIITGRQQTAMEIGHIQVVADGIRCGCGKRGCLETVASRLAIAGYAAQAAYRGSAPYLFSEVGTDLREIRSGVLSRSVAHGDIAVEQIIRQACGYLGQAIGTIVTLFAPDIIILGGGLVQALPELIVEATQTAALESTISVLHDSFEIRVAQLGDDASVLGAALWGARSCQTKAASGKRAV